MITRQPRNPGQSTLPAELSDYTQGVQDNVNAGTAISSGDVNTATTDLTNGAPRST
jgi:hypothetical protein